MRYSLFVLLLGSIHAVCSGQDPRFGFDIGISINKSAYTPDDGVSRRVYGGFDGGLLVEIPVYKSFSFQPEVNYSMAGVEINDGVSERTIKLGYIAIPVFAKLQVAKKLKLIAGPQHSILISAWADHSGNPSENIKPLFKFSDLTIIGGMEYMPGKNIFFLARYNHGMEQVAEELVGFEMKNRSVSLKVGYIFD